MRMAIRVLGVVLGMFWLGTAIYYFQLEVPLSRRIAWCATYLLLGSTFLLYGVRGRLTTIQKKAK